MKAFLIRLAQDYDRTLGRMMVFDILSPVWTGVTLEPPWKDNKKNISCIPAGKYKVIPHKSPKFGDCLLIKSVPKRSHILFHWGNFPKDTQGCILVGTYFKDLDSDGTYEIANSRNAFNKLLEKAPEGFDLEIINGDE